MAAPDADLWIEPVVADGAIATWAEVHNRAAPCRPEGVDSRTARSSRLGTLIRLRGPLVLRMGPTGYQERKEATGNAINLGWCQRWRMTFGLGHGHRARTGSGRGPKLERARCGFLRRAIR